MAAVSALLVFSASTSFPRSCLSVSLFPASRIPFRPQAARLPRLERHVLTSVAGPALSARCGRRPDTRLPALPGKGGDPAPSSDDSPSNSESAASESPYELVQGTLAFILCASVAALFVAVCQYPPGLPATSQASRSRAAVCVESFFSIVLSRCSRIFLSWPSLLRTRAPFAG